MQDLDEYPLEIPIAGCILSHPSQDQEDLSSQIEGDTDYSSQESASHNISQIVLMYKSDLQKIREFEKPTIGQLADKKVTLGPKTKKYTLFIDLDHTLVYTELIRASSEKNDDILFNVKFRPFANELIKEMADIYEICIFTAAGEEYANEVVSLLDPERKYIRKVISRKHCIELNANYVVKDLRIIEDRELKNILIVDDSIYSYSFQIENGIPIRSFEGEEEDKELLFLINYLRGLSEGNPENLAGSNKNKLWSGIDLILG